MIRKLSKKDISHVSDMIKTYLEISHEYKEFNEERLLNTLKLVLDEPNNLFVIVNDEDAAIGYINFHISELIVHEGERSKNLGTKLINFAIDRARELSCERVMLNNSMESISYKRNFYKNLGFSQRDTMANFVLNTTD